MSRAPHELFKTCQSTNGAVEILINLLMIECELLILKETQFRSMRIHVYSCYVFYVSIARIFVFDIFYDFQLDSIGIYVNTYYVTSHFDEICTTCEDSLQRQRTASALDFRP